ncbi:MAG: hypothetical protein A2086_17245 [Spirochaetes bacterium GWD1_27_9]|nr:MAG: hypothetical protein A2Z98_12410 [Spirochaetes bacterium GWB1_27_13]OHD42467.1 MAG: hypothetical protein A2086_17245 [Spirochaetes bacterium GWD1_27_9]
MEVSIIKSDEDAEKSLLETEQNGLKRHNMKNVYYSFRQKGYTPSFAFDQMIEYFDSERGIYGNDK